MLLLLLTITCENSIKLSTVFQKLWLFKHSNWFIDYKTTPFCSMLIVHLISLISDT